MLLCMNLVGLGYLNIIVALVASLLSSREDSTSGKLESTWVILQLLEFGLVLGH
jgi:hypothetical protein